MESDARCDELDTKNRLLEGQVTDLQEQLAQQTVTDDHIVNLVQTRAQEWEVRTVYLSLSELMHFIIAIHICASHR